MSSQKSDYIPASHALDLVLRVVRFRLKASGSRGEEQQEREKPEAGYMLNSDRLATGKTRRCIRNRNTRYGVTALLTVTLFGKSTKWL